MLGLARINVSPLSTDLTTATKFFAMLGKREYGAGEEVEAEVEERGGRGGAVTERGKEKSYVSSEFNSPYNRGVETSNHR